MSEFTSTLSQTIQQQKCIAVVVSKPFDKQAVVQKLSIRRIVIRDETRWQVSMREAQRETHENVTDVELIERLDKAFPADYVNAVVFTDDADFQFRAKRNGKVKVIKGKPTRTPEVAEHDRTKKYLIPDGVPCPFLEAIGVMSRAGKIHKSKFAKFRQINRFLEFINDVADALPNDEINIVDFGCGKSYLTFAMHHFFHNIQGMACNIVGLDLKEDVIRDCQSIANSLGLTGIDFQVGDVHRLDCERRVDLVVSLHACDTATDATIAQAIRWDARVLLSVPCCQHELAAQMSHDTLIGVTEHGILKERFAAIATDALRAKLLEHHGYQTTVMEFIDMEHTAKNLLIRSIRSSMSSERKQQAVEDFTVLKKQLMVDDFALERLLGNENVAKQRF